MIPVKLVKSQIEALETMRQNYLALVGLDKCLLCCVNDRCATCIWVLLHGDNNSYDLACVQKIKLISGVRESPEENKHIIKKRLCYLEQQMQALKETLYIIETA